MTTQTESGVSDTPDGTQVDDSPPRKLRAANLFCGAGSLATAAKSAGIDVVYLHDTNGNSREAYAKKFGVRPAEGMVVYFPDVPKFDLLMATLTRRNTRAELRLISRFLNARRPETFMVVGWQAADEEEQNKVFQEATKEFYYGAKGATEILNGVYSPLLGERPVTVGTYHLDPTAIPVLSSYERVENDQDTTANVMLKMIAQMYH